MSGYDNSVTLMVPIALRDDANRFAYALCRFNERDSFVAQLGRESQRHAT